MCTHTLLSHYRSAPLGRRRTPMIFRLSKVSVRVNRNGARSSAEEEPSSRAPILGSRPRFILKAFKPRCSPTGAIRRHRFIDPERPDAFLVHEECATPADWERPRGGESLSLSVRSRFPLCVWQSTCRSDTGNNYDTNLPRQSYLSYGQ